jgi:hypothetical protein
MVDQSVDWAPSPHEIHATFEPAVAPSSFPIDAAWHKGTRGFVREHVPLTDYTLAPGFATVHARGGTPLARIMGATDAVLPAQLNRYHFEADVDLCSASMECVS